LTEHERVLRAALEAGEDPHRAWAAHRLGIPPGEVTPEQRKQFKTESFNLLYSTTFLDSVNWGNPPPNQPKACPWDQWKAIKDIH
jgi:hypothetical protein